MDELLKKEKYRCEINGGLDGLNIADLFYKLADGSKRAVNLKKGEVLSTEQLNFDDIKRSRLQGSLKRCIDAGWVTVENCAFESIVITEEINNVENAEPQKGVTEIDAGILRADQISCKISSAPITKAPSVSPFPMEKDEPVKSTITEEQSRKHNAFAITENSMTMQSKYLDFDRLRYFQKLKTIKETTDLELLNEITSKSTYPQLVHNAKVRLGELVESK